MEVREPTAQPTSTGSQFFFQKLDFVIDTDSQTGCGRGEKQGDDGAAFIIVGIGDLQEQQCPHSQNAGNEQGIADGQLGPGTDPGADPVGEDAQTHSPKRRCKQLRHGLSSSP